MPFRRTTSLSHLGYPPDGGGWQYELIPESDIDSELERLAFSKTIHNVSCATLQPFLSSLEEGHGNQDRYVVEEWELPGGTWTFTAVFDGHAGTETADYTVEALPPAIKNTLTTSLASLEDATISPPAVSKILVDSISALDNQITMELKALFPTGIENLSIEDIKTIINGENNAKVLRCMRGTTALVALVDPAKKNLWVASLGDSQAVLGIKNSSGEWKASIVSANHNGTNLEEEARIKKEHPNEQKCVLNERVLGAIAVTRAIGDHLFKLEQIWTERVFKNCIPPFKLSKDINSFLGRNLTPPYVSNEAEVKHVDLAAESLDAQESFLILCSDGLVDLYLFHQSRPSTLQETAPEWVKVVGSAASSGNGYEKGAVRLLRDALGVNADEVSQMLKLEMEYKWMDDTTVLVQPL
ncbi:hypothetical protein HYDPIDRAFT_107139 [Hydnomerulius pinastri MD-312]|nr:hypothetical protein HYDPIDRAFT_107139 [Hydnomerulius pinastri MD-312]